MTTIALTALALLAGMGVAVALVLHDGVGQVLDLLASGGWALLPANALHGVQLVFAACGWRLVTRPDHAPSLRHYVVLRWLREGINGLLPVLPVAGPLAAMRMLTRRGVAARDAMAAMVADTTVELATEVAFTALGVALLMLTHGAGAVPVWVGAGLVGLCAGALLLLPAQWVWLGRLGDFLARHLDWARGIDGLGEAIQSVWRRKRRVAWALLAHFAAWLLGAGEVWLALRAFGQPQSLPTCLTIESLTGAVRTAAFIVPGALGVQEGGLVLIVGLFGLPASVGLAVSLFKRLREILFGAPSLALWLVLERRAPNLRRPSCPSAPT